jgi:hypothetical protein
VWTEYDTDQFDPESGPVEVNSGVEKPCPGEGLVTIDGKPLNFIPFNTRKEKGSKLTIDDLDNTFLKLRNDGLMSFAKSLQFDKSIQKSIQIDLDSQEVIDSYMEPILILSFSASNIGTDGGFLDISEAYGRFYDINSYKDSGNTFLSSAAYLLYENESGTKENNLASNLVIFNSATSSIWKFSFSNNEIKANQDLYFSALITTVMSVTGDVGFTVDETILGLSSGATALFYTRKSSDIAVYDYSINGTFSVGEVIEGQSSGVTASIESIESNLDGKLQLIINYTQKDFYI